MKVKFTIVNICVVAAIFYFLFLIFKFGNDFNYKIPHNNCVGLHWNIDSIISLPIDSVYNYKDNNVTHKIFYFKNNYVLKFYVKNKSNAISVFLMKNDCYYYGRIDSREMWEKMKESPKSQVSNSKRKKRKESSKSQISKEKPKFQIFKFQKKKW